jgi:hypothetical protein
VGKSVESCKAQEMAGSQRQSLEGSEGRKAGPGILRLPKRTILSSVPGIRARGVTITVHFVFYIFLWLYLLP